MNEIDIESLKNQLSIARNEINKLRQQIKNLTYIQRKDFDKINQILKDFQCEDCKRSKENMKNQNTSNANDLDSDNKDSDMVVNFRPVGIIRTQFPDKRAIPRQSAIGNRLRGAIELNSDVFTNPEHSIDGLEEFSHLWIIYHFHRNNSHPKAKIAPPRLCGERIGVFSTRSPHRPCPIGLSLVKIDSIDKSKIYFYGTDMVDGTPVLDIKPYIPFYDNPSCILTESSDHLSTECNNDGGSGVTGDFYHSRQEPDGEESETGATALLSSSSSSTGTTTANNAKNVPQSIFQHQTQQQISQDTTAGAVKVPNWIVSNNFLEVIFNDKAEIQLNQLNVDKNCIIDILKTDPRSVYLRTKYGCQIFTFQLGEIYVTCKFNDKNSSVYVVQVRRIENFQDEDNTIVN